MKKKKIFKRVISFLLTLGISVILTIPSYADPETTDNTVQVYLTETESAVDVTLTDHVTISGNQDSVDATISPITVTNNLDSGEVTITGIQAESVGDKYSLEEYSQDFTTFSADSHKYALAYETSDLSTGTELEDLLAPSESKNYEFSGKLSVSTEPITQEDAQQIGNLIFTVSVSIDESDPIPDITDGTAYAVYTPDQDLIFFRSNEEYTDGPNQTVVDILGTEYFGTVYTGIETMTLAESASSVPWDTVRNNILRTYVAKRQLIQPLEIAHWFTLPNATVINLTGFDLSNITTIANLTNGTTSSYGGIQTSAEDHQVILKNKTFDSLENLYGAFDCKNGTIQFSNNVIPEATASAQMFTFQNENIDINNTEFSSVTEIGYNESMFVSNYKGTADNPEHSIINAKNLSMPALDGDGAIIDSSSGYIYSESNNNVEDPIVLDVYLNGADFSGMTGLYRNFELTCTRINLTNADFSNATYGSYIFSVARENEIILNGADFSSLEDLLLVDCYDIGDFPTKIEAKEVDFSSLRGGWFFRDDDVYQTHTHHVVTLDLTDSIFNSLRSTHAMFHHITNLTMSDKMDTSNVTDMSEMFDGYLGETLTLPSTMDFSNVTNMDGIFVYCSNLTTVNMEGIHFDDAEPLKLLSESIAETTSKGEQYLTTLKTLNLTNCTFEDGTDVSGALACDALTTVYLNGWDPTTLQNVNMMFTDWNEDNTQLDAVATLMENIYVNQSWGDTSKDFIFYQEDDFCSVCGGSREKNCPECSGTGYVECTNCNYGYVERPCEYEHTSDESESIWCPECHGENSESCEYCWGSRYVECPNGDSGGIVLENCPVCGGSYYVTCPTCNGERYVECTDCTHGMEIHIRTATVVES